MLFYEYNIYHRGVKALDLISIFKKVNDREERLDIQEAFNVYNLLRARYVSI